MKFAISEVFCEIVSAVGFVAAFFPLLLISDSVRGEDTIEWMKNLVATDLLWIAVLSYVLGVLLNIIGLPADRLLKKLGISGQYPPANSQKEFYKNASSDLFAFRTNAWVHYYCFRNLLTFSPFGTVLWGIVVASHHGYAWAIALVLVSGPLIVLLYLAVKEHADFYSDVTKTFD